MEIDLPSPCDLDLIEYPHFLFYAPREYRVHVAKLDAETHMRMRGGAWVTIGALPFASGDSVIDALEKCAPFMVQVSSRRKNFGAGLPAARIAEATLKRAWLEKDDALICHGMTAEEWTKRAGIDSWQDVIDTSGHDREMLSARPSAEAFDCIVDGLRIAAAADRVCLVDANDFCKMLCDAFHDGEGNPNDG